MCAAAFLLGLNGQGALRVLLRDHKNHLSPNCAWSEAAAAGALGIQLGGDHLYFGKLVKKPTIGDNLRPVEIADISRAVKLMFVTSGLMALILVLVEVILCVL